VRYHLYVDESGDHTYKNLDHYRCRYLGLTGVAIESDYYRLEFQPSLEQLKQEHFPHNPDDPLILHREDIYNRRHAFGILDDPDRNARWERDFIDFVQSAKFSMITVVLDKKNHKLRWGQAAIHPYHRCLALLLERYRGFLMFHNATGDVIAEGRGGTEDLALKQTYRKLWNEGTSFVSSSDLQEVLASRELKIMYKKKNSAGLQFADLLAHPSKMHILYTKRQTPFEPCFGTRLAAIFQHKYDRIGKKLI